LREGKSQFSVPEQPNVLVHRCNKLILKEELLSFTLPATNLYDIYHGLFRDRYIIVTMTLCSERKK